MAAIIKTASSLGAHIRNHLKLWISLVIFTVLAWLLTSTSCVIRSIIGLPCPGCGLTRAFCALLQGDLAGAFRWHPLFWLAALILLAVPGLLAFRPGLLKTRQASSVWMVLAAVYLIVYIIRMILYFPDTEPLTYNNLSLFGRFISLIRMLDLAISG